MSMRAKCSVCDRPVEHPYAPDTHCERCKNPCPTCGGMVQYCTHPLVPYSPVRFDVDPESGRERFAA